MFQLKVLVTFRGTPKDLPVYSLALCTRIVSVVQALTKLLHAPSYHDWNYLREPYFFI